LIKVTTQGSFRNTDEFLRRMKSRSYLKQLSKYGPIGVSALASATPMESGKTAASWYYEIIDRPGYFAIHWLNSHIEQPGGVPIAAIIQYGHSTRNRVTGSAT